MKRINILREAPLGWVIFSNIEKKNALNYDMWCALPNLLEDLNNDNNIKVIIFKGDGDNFSAGADMSQFNQLRTDSSVASKYNEAVEKAYFAASTSSKPLISMIDGYCLGGGLGLALQGDLRIASEKAKFSIPAAKRGVGYSFENVKKLMDTVGHAFAREILFTGRMYDAVEALNMGMINKCFPVNSLEELTVQYALEIAENAPLTIKAVKASLALALKESKGPDLKRVNNLTAACFQSEDYREGYQAFLEKRKPQFKGK